MGIYARLGFTPPGVEPIELTVDTQAQLAHVDHGESRSYEVTEPGRIHRPVVAVDLWASGAGQDAQYEYTWRVGEGLWQIFQPFENGARVRLSSSLFSLPGPHRIELRARAIGLRRSLDPEPAIIDFIVDPQASVERIDPIGHLGPKPKVGVLTPIHGLLPDGNTAKTTDDVAPEGWSSTTTGSSLLWLLALSPLLSAVVGSYDAQATRTVPAIIFCMACSASEETGLGEPPHLLEYELNPDGGVSIRHVRGYPIQRATLVFTTP